MTQQAIVQEVQAQPDEKTDTVVSASDATCATNIGIKDRRVELVVMPPPLKRYVVPIYFDARLLVGQKEMAELLKQRRRYFSMQVENLQRKDHEAKQC